MTKLSEQIQKLRSDGKTYDQISEELQCSKSTVSYHCGIDQKSKSLSRTRSRRSKAHPYQSKFETFKYEKYKKSIARKQTTNSVERIYKKVHNFHNQSGKTKMSIKNFDFTVDDIIQKFGENPRCYLTNTEIDIYDTKSYEFDHKIPISRGGQNTLENLGICTKAVNRAKRDMTPDEFRNLCKLVIQNQ